MRSVRLLQTCSVVAAVVIAGGESVYAQPLSPPGIPSRLRIALAFAMPTDDHNLGSGGAIELEYQFPIRPLIMATTCAQASFIASNRSSLVPTSQREQLSGGNALLITVGGGVQLMGFGRGRPGDGAYVFLSAMGGIEYTLIPDVTFTDGVETSIIRLGEESTNGMFGLGVGIAAKPWSALRFDCEVRYAASAVKRLHVIVGLGLGV